MNRNNNSKAAIPAPAGGDLFATLYDLVVFGAGYAGYAAARAAQAAGQRVLLVDARNDLLWESSRTFHAASGKQSREFARFGAAMAHVTGIIGEVIDGGLAEWTANELLLDAGIERLYLAQPVALERDGDAVAAVTVACNEGLRRLAARQWLDATEEGLLAQLAGVPPPRQPQKRFAYLMLQMLDWPQQHGFTAALRGVKGGRITWQPSHWAAEWALQIELPGSGSATLGDSQLLALQELRRRLGPACEKALVSHASFSFYPCYGAGTGRHTPVPNLALAVPGYSREAVTSLNQRYLLGVAAFKRLQRQSRCESGAKLFKRPVALPLAQHTIKADIVVAGLGTAGAMAAIAAGRHHRRVVAFELQSFAGGVPVGAGIHAYYYGCPGGLQHEIDGKVAQLMPLFTPRFHWQGFHPHAKRIVLEREIAAAGVAAYYQSRLLTIEQQGNRINAALVATPTGICRVEAAAWIDSTNEAIICHAAGVPSRVGRDYDGNLHAYTQSCTAFAYRNLQLYNIINNPDSGFVDPTDSRDMTRARIAGLHSYKLHVNNAFNRAAGMVPTVGLRQGRMVETRYMVTLDDLIERRRFDDAIGYTGSHYDNHADDFFAEGDSAAFLTWAAGCWRATTACEIPYRAILPPGVDNLWLASRSAGGSNEACMSLRMQRDMQRLGEAAGVAAALALQHGCSNGEVPYKLLRQELLASGALLPPKEDKFLFGRAVTSMAGDPILNGPATAENIAAWLASLPEEHPTLAMWRLYRLEPSAVRPQLKALLHGASAAAALHAAVILAAWGDSSGESLLRQALADQTPVGDRKTPRSLAAVWALGVGGSQRAIAALCDYIVDCENQPVARLAAAASCARIAARRELGATARKRIEAVLPTVAAMQHAARPWQGLYLATRLRRTFGLPLKREELQEHLESDKLIVRCAFAALLQ